MNPPSTASFRADPPVKPRRRRAASGDDALAQFHPAVAGWFRRSFDAPTAAQ
ncbi:hypothetical protein G3N97_33425, partial [Paraburkholderia sp. Ac-20347]|nr:hypothetical protein [Paraburkholderia sp. Ac-20347]